MESMSDELVDHHHPCYRCIALSVLQMADDIDVPSLKVAELKTHLSERGLSTKVSSHPRLLRGLASSSISQGLKAELAARLQEAIDAAKAEPAADEVEEEPAQDEVAPPTEAAAPTKRKRGDEDVEMEQGA